MQTTKYGLAALRNHPLLWGCLLLAGVTLLNNWPVAFFDFAWDDYGYVVRNYPIQDPISLKSIAWCLTAFAEANWHPITWLLLHIEFQFFGLMPFGYHIVNLALHLGNVLLLFWLLYRMTGATGKSLAVAALFAVHPLHVESVAWISEIKDVLSTLLLMLTLHAYVSYAKRPCFGRYMLVALALALGLAAKPMLVTAPFVLLLLDAWPLGRWTRGPLAARLDLSCPRYGTGRLIWEKVPLFALVVATCILTFLAQREGGAVAGLGGLPITFRLANAANSYVLYFWRLLWPWPLSFFYPLANISLTRAIACGVGLIAASLGAYITRRRLPYLLVGWLWFLGTLVPVIGLVQVGSQAFADRYTYIPSIGLFVAGIWLADALRRRLGLSLLLPAVLTSALVFTAMLVSFAYLRHWANEAELYSYALDTNDNNAVGHNNYGNILVAKGKIMLAEHHYKKALRYSPNSPLALNNLAVLKRNVGRQVEAIYYLTKAIALNPHFAGSYLHLANIRIQAGDDAAAEQLLRACLKENPKNLDALNTLGEVLASTHREADALALFRQGLAKAYDKDPVKAFFLNNIGAMEMRFHHEAEAKAAFRAAMELQPKFLLALLNLARVQLKTFEYPAAKATLEKALSLNPRNSVALILYGNLALAQKHYARAYIRFRRALSVKPRAVDAHEGLATVLRAMGLNDAADIQAAAATELRLRPAMPKPQRPWTEWH